MGVWLRRRPGVARDVSGTLAWLAALFAFHTYFNPAEVLLYLTVPVAVLTYAVAAVLAAGYTGGESPTHRERAVTVGVLAIVVATLVAVNHRPVFGL